MNDGDRDNKPPNLSNQVIHDLKKIEQDIDGEGEKAEARTVVFSRLSEIMLDSAGTLSSGELSGIDNMMLELIDHVELSIRANLAQRLSLSDQIPEGIASLLINDDIRVARSLLESGKGISDGQLIDVINKQGTEHQLAISKREQIPENVTDALIEKGSPQVIVSTVNNPGAALSQESMNKLVGLSEKATVLHEPLLKRPELTKEKAQVMFWSVSNTLRTHILENYAIDEDYLDQVMVEATQESLTKSASDDHFKELVSRVASVGAKELREYITVLRSKEELNLTGSLVSLLSVSPGTAQKILNDKGGEALAIACKAIDAGLDQFTRMFLLIDQRQYGQPRPTAQLDMVQQAFSMVSPTEARNILRVWDVQERQQEMAQIESPKKNVGEA